jgi:predicted membrane chloride channel (bestrophin family)
MNSYTISFSNQTRYQRVYEFQQMYAETLLEARTIARDMSQQHAHALITDRTGAVESYVNGEQTSSSF